MEIEGERTYKQDNFTTLEPFAEGDLYLSVMKGAPGLGDPLLRPPEAVAARRATRGTCCRGSPSPSTAWRSTDGEADVAASEARRVEMRGSGSSGRCRCASGGRRERERVVAQDFIEPVKVCYAESMRLSARFAAEFRGFWDLPEDFEFEAVTPTVAAERAEPGKITPEESADEFLAASRVESIEPPRAGGGTLDRETLGGAARREALAARGQGHPVRLQGPRPVREVGRGAPGAGALRRADRAADGGGVERGAHRQTGSWSSAATAATTSARRRATGRWRRRSSSATTPRSCSRSTRRWPTATPSGWSCASSTARPAPASSRPRRSRPGYPVVHEFLPDIEGFYRGWLGREVAVGERRAPAQAAPAAGTSARASRATPTAGPRGGGPCAGRPGQVGEELAVRGLVELRGDGAAGDLDHLVSAAAGSSGWGPSPRGPRRSAGSGRPRCRAARSFLASLPRRRPEARWNREVERVARVDAPGSGAGWRSG